MQFVKRKFDKLAMNTSLHEIVSIRDIVKDQLKLSVDEKIIVFYRHVLENINHICKVNDHLLKDEGYLEREHEELKNKSGLKDACLIKALS